ncbi:zinc finger BED domain-containing protein RICESLEEPER 2-like [Humulus lupulus]|uniref:zinc finger BED domain-containing protein RICESLEEPER 2-like n=1 Tax=Humulus lupulus TaxID=3486 RepID=UPI002B414D21|nr:zinc finger BED domain-containing protein RICESLEEPER 2-like [Humulus lupulus]
MRCCAHIVNLIVTDGLKEKHDSIASIRHAVRYVRYSPASLKRFKEVVVEEKIACQGLLSLDVQTRWNSTYLMLNCALRIQKAFESLLSDENFVKYFEEVDKDGKKKEGPPTETNWENATVFVKFLETFYEITLRFSRSTYFSIDKYFVEICNMQRTLYRMAVEEDDPLLASMAQSLKMVNEVEQTLRSLFDLYGGGSTLLQPSMTQSQSLSHYLPQPSGSSSSAFTTTSSLNKYASLHDEFGQQRKEDDGGKTKNEVDRYLTEDAEATIKDVNFDILKWWAGNASKYKILSTIAHDVLAIPVTTIASDATFSTDGRILDPFRSSLSPKMVECLICLKTGGAVHINQSLF